MRKLELLAPAKNLDCGIAAIEHGADAVYIGAPSFGARYAAGNPVQDIGELCMYAHRFGAKVYATVNTLLHDDEVPEAYSLMSDLKAVGVDAFLIQDARLLRPGYNIHASTQTDNRTAEKVKWLTEMGIRRVVLARELSLDEIREIHQQVPEAELEVFVHGALCVSYSGACYASEFCFNRSANRGECAQFCRMRFDLVDANGQELIHQRHLLSLRDMCRIDALEELAEAGVVSFKIEGRLKGIDYVKNTVTAYNEQLNKLVAKHPQKYTRSSLGQVECAFKPNLRKTFNRGYISYFLHGRESGMASIDSPKSTGEFVGRVKEINIPHSITVSSMATFANGDGLCFFNTSHELVGFRVNRVEGNRLYPFVMPKGLMHDMEIYRNDDITYRRMLNEKTAVRKIALQIVMGLTDTGFRLQARSEAFCQVVCHDFEVTHEKAMVSQHDSLCSLLGRLGMTSFSCKEVLFEDDADEYFIPRSLLVSARRELIEKIEKVIHDESSALADLSADISHPSFLISPKIRAVNSDYFLTPRPQGLLMECRYCLLHELGRCKKRSARGLRWVEPLTLRLGNGQTFRLEFDCKQCKMNVYAK